MMTPAQLERAMKMYEESVEIEGEVTDGIRRKAVKDVVDTLNQFGFAASTKIFEKLMLEGEREC